MCKLQRSLSSAVLTVPLQSPDAAAIANSSEILSAGVEPSSACLWAMVNDFLEVDFPVQQACTHEDQIMSRASGSAFFSSCGANSSDSILKRAIQEMESIKESSTQDVAVAKVASCVAKALKYKSSVVGVESTLALPGVLKQLQSEGYNAGLCLTARKPGNATAFLPTGGHLYIDVIMKEKPVLATPAGKRSSDKLIVDVNFCSHFEIARPLPAYQKLIALLPSTFVGKATLLQRVLRIMSQAARASLESQDMPIPPWRCFSFLLAKWFSDPSCSRITSFDEAKHIVLNCTSSFTNHRKPCVLAELDYNSDSANLADPPVKDNCRNGSKLLFLQKDAAQAWYPPPPASQNSINNNDSDDNSTSSPKKRRQANVVSALALAFAETQDARMLTDRCVAAGLQGKAHKRPQQAAAAGGVL